jgi:hypothetical protein
MRKIARLRSDGESRQAWTLVLVFLAYLALTPTIGLISPRSRSAAEPRSASIVIAENEPPTSPLVLPRPPEGAALPALAEHAGIGKDVIVAGVHDHIEIWDRSAWATQLSAIEGSAGDVAERLADRRS